MELMLSRHNGTAYHVASVLLSNQEIRSKCHLIQSGCEASSRIRTIPLDPKRKGHISPNAPLRLYQMSHSGGHLAPLIYVISLAQRHSYKNFKNVTLRAGLKSGHVAREKGRVPPKNKQLQTSSPGSSQQSLRHLTSLEDHLRDHIINDTRQFSRTGISPGRCTVHTSLEHTALCSSLPPSAATLFSESGA